MNCRSSVQIRHVRGGASAGGYCVPQAVQMEAGMKGRIHRSSLAGTLCRPPSGTPNPLAPKPSVAGGTQPREPRQEAYRDASRPMAQTAICSAVRANSPDSHILPLASDRPCDPDRSRAEQQLSRATLWRAYGTPPHPTSRACLLPYAVDFLSKGKLKIACPIRQTILPIWGQWILLNS